MSEEASLKVRIITALIVMAAFVLLAIATAGCAAQVVSVRGVTTSQPPNLQCWSHENPNGTGGCARWRSGQPTAAQVKSLGVRSVLKLNTALEAREQLPVGVEPLEHPWLFVGPVSHEAVLAALYDLEHAVLPTLVHCTHGVDRTGLLIALYRVLVEHRPASSAWAEWRSFPRSKYDGLLYDAFERETGFHVPEDER